ncbi:MAG: hypothetical protein LW875_12450 [Proteobacteria bacterium]|nr:hypothetical protein [Pseudomonadota bacterium]
MIRLDLMGGVLVKRLSWGSLVLMLVGSLGFAQNPTEARKWLEKQALQVRLAQREILVVCHRESLLWDLKGAGQVAVPEAFLEAKMMAFEELKELTELIQEVHWDSRAQKLKLKFEGWGLRGNSLLQIDFRPKGNLLSFEIVEGAFLGFKGHLEYRAAKDQVQQLAFYGKYHGKFWGFFDFFAPIAVEGVLDYVATSTRSRWEKDYARSLAHKK